MRILRPLQTMMQVLALVQINTYSTWTQTKAVIGHRVLKRCCTQRASQPDPKLHQHTRRVT